MKKTISWLLALSLLMTLFIPAVSAEEAEPTVYNAVSVQEEIASHQFRIYLNTEKTAATIPEAGGIIYFKPPVAGDYVFQVKFEDTTFNGKSTVAVKGLEESNASYNVEKSADFTNAGATTRRARTTNHTPFTLSVADGLYGLVLKTTSVTAGTYNIAYVDALRTTVSISGDTVIPAEMQSKMGSGVNAKSRDNRDATVTANYLNNNYPNHTKVGNFVFSPILPRENSVIFTLDVKKPGYYKVDILASFYQGTGAEETAYFKLDSGAEVTKKFIQAGPSVISESMYLSAGDHTLTLRRPTSAEGAINNNMYLWLVALTELKPIAAMYKGSVDAANAIAAVEDGTLIATIDSNGTLANGSTVNAFFAIYDNNKQMVAVDSFNGTLADGKVTLTIENFDAAEGKTYTAKAFFWNDKFWGDCITLTE